MNKRNNNNNSNNNNNNNNNNIIIVIIMAHQQDDFSFAGFPRKNLTRVPYFVRMNLSHAQLIYRISITFLASAPFQYP